MAVSWLGTDHGPDLWNSRGRGHDLGPARAWYLGRKIQPPPPVSLMLQRGPRPVHGPVHEAFRVHDHDHDHSPYEDPPETWDVCEAFRVHALAALQCLSLPVLQARRRRLDPSPYENPPGAGGVCEAFRVHAWAALPRRSSLPAGQAGYGHLRPWQALRLLGRWINETRIMSDRKEVVLNRNPR